MKITWAQLKAKVDEKLREAGKGDDVPIDYIDFSGWDAKNIEVFVSDEGLSVH